MQITNFVLAGLLSIAFAVGMWLVLHPGLGGTWGPVLTAVFGAGLIVGGVFITDPSLGFHLELRRGPSATTAGTRRSTTSRPAFRLTQ